MRSGYNISNHIASGGGAGFSPPVAGYEIALTSDAGVLNSTGPDVEATDGQSVVQWQDQSGNGNHFACNSSYVTYEIPVSGSPYLILTSGILQVHLASNPLGSSTTVFIVGSTSDSRMMWMSGHSDAQYRLAARSGHGGAQPAVTLGGSLYINGAALTTGSEGGLYTQANTGGISIVSHLGGDWSGVSNLTAFSATTSAGYSNAGDLYCFLAYDSTLSGADHSSVISYLQSYYS